jgi:hypothetical protein
MAKVPQWRCYSGGTIRTSVLETKARRRERLFTNVLWRVCEVIGRSVVEVRVVDGVVGYTPVGTCGGYPGGESPSTLGRISPLPARKDSDISYMSFALTFLHGHTYASMLAMLLPDP